MECSIALYCYLRERIYKNIYERIRLFITKLRFVNHLSWQIIFFWTKNCYKILPDKITKKTAKNMDCACEDGIPGSDFRVEGRSWFSIRLSKTESNAFKIDPEVNHKASASCLQRMKLPKRAVTIHLLCQYQH